MLDILDIPELGKLEIVEVYEYYDQPVLYSCKNASGHFYLGSVLLSPLTGLTLSDPAKLTSTMHSPILKIPMQFK